MPRNLKNTKPVKVLNQLYRHRSSSVVTVEKAKTKNANILDEVKLMVTHDDDHRLMVPEFGMNIEKVALHKKDRTKSDTALNKESVLDSDSDTDNDVLKSASSSDSISSSHTVPMASTSNKSWTLPDFVIKNLKNYDPDWFRRIAETCPEYFIDIAGYEHFSRNQDAKDGANKVTKFF